MIESLRRRGRLPDFEAVLRRFPVAVACMAALMLVFMLDPIAYAFEEGLVFGLILAGYICVGTQLAMESRARVPAWGVLAKVLLAGAAVTLSVFREPLAFFPVVAIGAAIVFLGNLAFAGRERDDSAVWIFTQRFWTGAIFAFVGSVLFAVGVWAIYAALNTLFGLEDRTWVTRFILPVGLAFLAPAYWMGTIPNARALGRDAEEGLHELSFEARALAFLGTWLLAPLTLIYGAILVAYALRILIRWDLPSNEIGLLVTPFIIVGTLTWLMLEPSVMKAGALIRLYRRIWFPVMALATVLLAISIGVRVAQYGLTPERVAMIFIVVAAFAMSLWFSLTQRGDIRIPTAVAAGFLLAGSFLVKPVADVQQYLSLRSALAAADPAAVANQAQRAARYLAYPGRRSDWLSGLLDMETDDAADWEQALIERGYVPTAPDGSTQVEETYGTVTYELTAEIPLDGLSRVIGTYDVYVQPDEGSAGSPSGEMLMLMEDTGRFQVDGRTVTFDADEFIANRFSQLGLGTVDPIGLGISHNTRQIDGEELIGFDVTLPDGREGWLVLTKLSLNGDGYGKTLTGGYGEALLFGR